MGTVNVPIAPRLVQRLLAAPHPLVEAESPQASLPVGLLVARSSKGVRSYEGGEDEEKLGGGCVYDSTGEQSSCYSYSQSGESFLRSLLL